MAIVVPKLDGPQVQQQGLPNTRVQVASTSESFGGGQAASRVFQGAEAMASEAGKLFDEERKKANDIAANDAFVRLRKEKQRLQWDPKEGAMTRKGKNAFGVMEEFGPKFDTTADEIEKDLKNDEQKAMFRKIRAQERMDLDDHLQRHVFSEAKDFDKNTTMAGIAVERDEAVLNYNDPSKVARSIQMQRDLLITNAQREGMSPEQTELLVTSELSKTNAAVMERYLANGEDMRAKEYFEANRASFTGADSAVMEKALEEGSIRGESQRQTDKIMAEGLTMSQAIARARTIEDPKLRDAVNDRIKQEFSLKDAAKRDGEEALSLKATNIIEAGGSWDDVPAADIARMNTATRVALQNYARDKAEGKMAPANSRDYYNLKLMAAEPATREKFLTLDVRQYAGKITNAEMKEMIDAQADAKKSGSTKSLDGFMTSIQVANDAMKSIDIQPDSDEAIKFRERLDRETADFAQRTGKKPSNEELREIARKISVKVVTDDGWLWDSKKRAFELTPEDKAAAVDYDDIPQKSRTEIESYLKSKRARVTPEAVEAFYLQMVR